MLILLGGSHSRTNGLCSQALQELQRGEKAATALEQKLSAMEARIDALMAQAEQEQQEVQQGSRVAVKSGQDGTTDEEKA